MHPTQPDNSHIIQLDDLLTDFEISVRTYNVCLKHGLLELPRLIEFYVGVEDFTLLEGAGRETHQELEKICKFFLHHQNLVREATLESQKKQEEQYEASIISPTNLSSEHLAILEAFIRQKFITLPIRGQNALQTFLGNQVSYPALHHYFYNEGLSAISIRNVGAKTLIEIQTFLTELKHFARAIADKCSDELLEEFIIGNISQILDLKPNFWEIFRPQMQLKQFPLFKFLESIILENKLFKAQTTIIARRRFGWFIEESDLNLDQIGQTLGLTRERVRQIAVDITEKLPTKLRFLSVYKKQLLELSGGYGIDTNKDLLFIRKAFADDINQMEGTGFTPRFFILVFSFLHNDTHLLFGEQFDFFQNHYLIRRELTDIFDFEAFVNDLRRQTSERIEEDCFLDLDGYLYSFLKTSEIFQLKWARRVCEDLLLLEFEKTTKLDLPDNLVLCRNTKIRILDYTTEALEHRGKPMHITEVYTFIQERYPELEITEGAIRSTLQREKTQFIYFGRSSTYALAKWETEHEHIRGGTIRDIVEDYLMQFSEPKHYYDITDFVLLYRPNTSPKSVHTNLQYDESGRFHEFSAGFWGLTERNYGNFQVQPMSNQTFTHFKTWLTAYPDALAEEAIEYLSKRCQVQPVQIRAWLDEKVRSGTLCLENGKIILSK